MLFQLPSLVTFVALCLGFHREAPTPPVRRLAWWGGGALLVGVLGGFALGSFVVPVAAVVLRVAAFVRGDFVLGRALSVFAVLELAPLAFLLAGGEVFGIALVLAVLLVIVTFLVWVGPFVPAGIAHQVIVDPTSTMSQTLSTLSPVGMLVDHWTSDEPVGPGAGLVWQWLMPAALGMYVAVRGLRRRDGSGRGRSSMPTVPV